MKKRVKFRSLGKWLAALICLTLGLSLIPAFLVYQRLSLIDTSRQCLWRHVFFKYFIIIES